MKGLDVDILAFVDTEQYTDYQSWKKVRPILIKSLGHRLISLPEAEIVQRFDRWYREIRVNAKIERVKLQTNVLLAFSVLNYFEKDLDRLKTSIDIINELTKNKNYEVSRSATKVLFWAARDMPDAVNLLKEPAELSFTWINERKTKLYVNALLVIKRAKKYLVVDIVHDIAQNIQSIFPLINSEDMNVRLLAVNVISFMLQQLTVRNDTNHAMNIFSDCYRSILQKQNNILIYGPLLILYNLYRIKKSIFAPHMSQFIPTLSELCLLQNEPIALVSFQFANLIAKEDAELFDRASINRIYQGYITKCSKSSIPKPFYLLLKDSILLFKQSAPIKNITEFIQKIIINSSNKKWARYAFEVFATALQVFPSIVLPPNVYLNTPINIPYIKCLQSHPVIPPEIKSYVLMQLHRCLNTRVQPEFIITALYMARSFQLQLFESYEKMHEAIMLVSDTTTDSVREKLVKTVSTEPTMEAHLWLLSTAIYDVSKNVRLKAIKHLKPTTDISLNNEIILLVRDSCFKVRRCALEMIAELIKFNPFDFFFPISEFVGQAVTTLRTTSNVKVAAKYASLMPIFVSDFIDVIGPFVPNIIGACLDLLCGTEDEEPPVHSENLTESQTSDTLFEMLNDTIYHRDGFNDPDSFVTTLDKREKTEPKRTKIFKILNAKYFDQRDMFLLNTIAKLGNLITPFLSRTLSAFYRVFTTRKSNVLLASAVNSLTLLSTKIDTGFNLRLHHQHFIPVLMKLLISTEGNEVSVAILKLFGTACDSVNTSEVEASAQAELGVDIKSKSFFTDFTISHLKPYFNAPSMQLFEAVTRIYDSAEKDAAKFINLVIPMFLKGIETFNDINRDVLFESLEVITRQCLSESTQFLHQLTQTQLKYLHHCNSIKLAASLSFHLLSGYITQASILFLPATRMMNNPNRNYFKYLMKFLSFSIIFQGQSIEAFLDAVENRLRNDAPINPVIIKKLSKTIAVLIQSKDFSMYQSRISLLVRKMLTYEQTRQNVVSLLPSLCICTHIPLAVIEKWLPSLNLSLPYLSQLKGIPSNTSVIDVEFIKQQQPKFKLYHPPMPFTSQSNKFFLDLNLPDELNIGKWLDDLCQRVISQSPSVVIRSCANLANTMSTFRQQLFPMAFLSCWQEASGEEKTYFSAIVRHVIHTFSHIGSFFMQIIELLDRALCPIPIGDVELADASDSRPLTLFFLQRLFKRDPKNHKIIEKLLDLNTTMGRHAAAHGMLVHAKGLLEDTTAALWSEKLGEWDKALQLYAKLGDTNCDISSIIRCYSQLEMWDKIKSMGEQFESWDTKLKEETAKHFAWAYYHSDDFEKVDYYCSRFHKEQHLSEMLFWIFYLLKTGKYDQCQAMITKGFDLLAKDTSVYIGGDAIRLHKNLHYSQMFIELQESLNILRNGIVEVDFARDIWNKRLKGFKRDSESWIRLIAIRSLVFAPGEYINVYLKMISVLRKERRWNLIDTFFNRFFRQSIHPNVELEQSKILWARGMKDEAIESLKSVLHLIEISESSGGDDFIYNLRQLIPSRINILIGTLIKQQEFDFDASKEILNSDNINGSLKIMNADQHKSFLISLCQKSPEQMFECFESMFNSFDMDTIIEARIYRTLGTFTASSPIHTKEELENVALLFENGKIKNSSDYKIWLGLAYANARLIDVVPSNSDKYSVNAVQGFLKATQLRSANTLEFLCQMFSIFFRVKDSKTIDNNLISDLLELPPNIIVEIIPQITVQIAHSDKLIRDVVSKILMKFGEKHFEALFYPLKLYESCDEIKAKAAHDLLLALGNNHKEVAEDANLFVDGMLRAAISWFESWIIALDVASRANHDNNTAKMDKILRAQFQQYDNPKCDLDRLFIRNHEKIVIYCRNRFKEHTKDSIRQMWDSFKQLFRDLSDRIKRLELILLPKVSETLATKRGFKIVVPGTYSVLHPVPTLESIEPALQILGTQQHPRCVFMISSDGNKVKFLLKGNEDIRLDQRVMQFFTLINSLLNRTRTTRELGAQIVKYAIVPLAPNAGLITWVTGADTLHQMICEQRALREVPQSFEFELLQEFVGGLFQNLTFPQKHETFKNIAESCDANEVHEVLWTRAPNAATWMNQNLNFTVTTALMSMVGYVIGLGDRHPSNIMVQRESGRVIHIDFGDSFESTIIRASYPEMVPFRLTRMIVNALDSGTIEGIFRKTCEDVMWVLRDSKASIVALLEIFIHEPLEETEGKGKLKSQTKIIDRVAQKLIGRDEMLFTYDEKQPDMDVESHVDALVREAADPSRYVRHYHGWCPFW